MLHEPLKYTLFYEKLHPGLAAAFSFLRRPDLAALADGRHPIDGERLYAIVARAEGRGTSASPLETHDRFIDIHYVIAGQDLVGWQTRAKAGASRGYVSQSDLELYDGAAAYYLDVKPGELAVFFPHDAHAPLAGEGGVHKVVVKVALDYEEESR